MARRITFRGLNATLQLLAGGPTDLSVVVVTNSSGAAAFIQLFDQASTGPITLGTTPPDFTVEVGAGASVSLPLASPNNRGLRFGAGIVAASTTTDGGLTGSGATVTLTLGV